MKSLIFLLFLVPTVLFSFHDHEEKESHHDDSMLEKTLNSVENNLKVVYEKLNLSSKYIDEFVTNEYDDQVYTDSYIRFETTLEDRTNESLSIDPDIDIKIKLPKLKERLSLVISNRDNKVNPNFQDSEEKTNYDDNKYSAGLLYNLFKKDFDFKFKIGVKFNSSPYAFAEARANKDITINYNSNFLLSQRFKYSDRRELENFTALRYSYKLSSKLIFSNFNEYYINTKDEFNNFHNSIRLNQKLSKKSYLNYVGAVDTNDDNSNLKPKEYTTYVSYRKYIRKWLYYDIVPNINWLEETNYKDNYGIKLRLGILISK